MRDPRQAAEIDVVPAGDACQRRFHLTAQVGVGGEAVGKNVNRLPGRMQQLFGLPVVVQARLELIEPVVQGMDELVTAVGILLQIVLQIGIARHYPHVPQDLEQHASRAPGATQVLNESPVLLAEETDDDFPVGEGGVIVGDFAYALAHGRESFRAKAHYTRQPFPLCR